MLLFHRLPTSQPLYPHRLDRILELHIRRILRTGSLPPALLAILRAVLPSAVASPEITLSTIAPFVRSNNRTIEPVPHFLMQRDSVELDILSFPIEHVRNGYRCTLTVFFLLLFR